MKRYNSCIVMYLKLSVLCIFNLLTAKGFKFYSINDGYRGLVDEVEALVLESRAHVTEQWIEQKLDHFNANDDRTWKMRYFQKLHFWKTNGPIYLFINGEAAATPNFLATGVVYELAKETNGAMFLSEHRYYGESQPVNRSHFNVEKMKYLSSAQALADNAKLLKTIKENVLYNTSKIVVIGGSYAGNLAAWMKMFYPDLVNAVISSSGPVQAKRDFYEYLEVVSNDYETYGTPDCLEKLKNKFLRYESLFQTDDGIQQLKEEEFICNSTDMTKTENKQLFFLSKASKFKSTAQYGTVETIKKRCSELKDVKDTKLISDTIKYYWNDEINCFEYDFDKMLLEYYKEEHDENLCWAYQTCTEFGYFQTSTSNDQPFTANMPVEWYDKFCTGLFGVGFNKDKINEGVMKMNDMFGGKSPNVTEVVFVNGELDPWSSLGVLEDISYDAPAVYIPKSSHCRDLFSNTEDDVEELKQARVRIKDQIKKWIGADDNVSSVS